MNSASYLIVYTIDFASQNIHVRALAIAADLLLAVHACAAVRLLRADVAALHDLAGEWIGQIAGDFDVELEKALQCDVGGKALNAIVGNSMLGTALGTLYLASYVVSQACKVQVLMF